MVMFEISWLFLTLAGAFCVAGARIFQKIVLSDKKSDAFVFSFFFQLLVAGVFLAYTQLTNTWEFPNLTMVWKNILLMTGLYALGNLFSFKAYKYAEASEASILFSTGTIWSIVTALIFLDEKLSIYQLLGILIVIVGIVITYFEKTGWKFNKGHIFALVSSLFYGVAFTNDVYIISKYQSIASYMFIIFFLPSLATLAFRPRSLSKLGVYFSSFKKTLAVTSSVVLYSFSVIALFTAYKLGGQASIISPIFQTSMIFTVLFGYFFLKEKKRLWQKIVGILFAFGGVLLIVSS